MKRLDDWMRPHRQGRYDTKPGMPRRSRWAGMSGVRAPGEPWYTALYREPYRLWWVPAVLMFPVVIAARRTFLDESLAVSMVVAAAPALVALVLSGRRYRSRQRR